LQFRAGDGGPVWVARWRATDRVGEMSPLRWWICACGPKAGSVARERATHMASSKHDTDANALRRGRCSQRGASYFVTFCVQDRKPVLIPHMAQSLMAEARQMTVAGIWKLRCLTVMPDHVHLYFVLGSSLTLAQSVTRLKVRVKEALKVKSASWQGNFYDHRIRQDDSIESIIRYIWMNPYRKNLLPTGKIWPWFYCRAEEWAWFEGLTDSGKPYPAWLG
jgi:REP element-mobilizing transposase RayT